MSKQKRLERRAKRQANTAKRQQKWEELKAAIANTPEIEALENSPYEKRFKEVWPAVKAALEFAITLKITRERIDKALARTISVGDRMAGGEAITDSQSLEFLEKLEKVWSWIRKALVIGKVFTGDEIDKKIDKIIEIGDWILGDEGEDEGD